MEFHCERPSDLTTREAVALSRRFVRTIAEHCQAISLILHYYGISLRAAKRFDDACKAGAGAIAFFSILCDHDANQYRTKLANALCNHSMSFREAGLTDTCMVAKQYFALFHQLWNSGQELEVDPQILRYIDEPLRGRQVII